MKTCPKCGLYYNPIIEGSIPLNGCKCKLHPLKKIGKLNEEIKLRIICRTCGKEGHDAWGTIGGWTMCNPPKTKIGRPKGSKGPKITKLNCEKFGL